jgi:cytochrome P450/Na+/melibiose symporter-like transporter
MKQDVEPMPAERLPLRTILAFSAAGLPVNAVSIAVFVYLPPYLTGHLGVSLALVGSLWMIVRLFDIPVDVLLALAMDRTVTRLGRYRPWLIAGAPILSLALWELFMAPFHASGGYLIVWLLALYLGVSIIGLSTNAWGATLATRYHDRSRLFGVQTAIGVGGALAVLLIPIFGRELHSSDATNVMAMGWFMVALTPVTIALTASLTPERIFADAPGRQGVVWAEVWAVLAKPDLLRLFLSQTALTMGPTWMSGVYIFYFTQARGYTLQEASLLLAVYIVAGVPGALAAAGLARRIGKHRTLIASTTAYSIGLCTVLIVPHASVIGAVPTMAWCGAMAASFGLMIQAMLADVGDEVRLDQGKERTSLVYALNGLAAKVAGAFSMLSLPLLQVMGFHAAEGAVNSHQAITRLSWAFIAGPIFFVLLGGACVLGWRMTAERQAQIRRELDARFGGAETAAASEALPVLAGSRQSAPARRRRRVRGEGFFAAIPAAAYETPIHHGRSLIFFKWVLVSDPAGVRRVLVENAANYPKTKFDLAFFAAIFGGGLLGLDGEDWRRHRRIMAPAFDPRSVAAYGPAMAATVQTFIERWDALPDSARVDMDQEMRALALEVISRTVFSTDSGEMKELVRDHMLRGMAHAGAANLLDLLPLIGARRMRRRVRELELASRPLDDAIARLLAEREAAPKAGPADLITRLMAARDSETGGRLTAKEIRDEIVTIYIAGHETTATTLAWSWYALSQRPEHMIRVQAELDEVLGGRAPGFEDLPRLAYTRRVVEECMRLYPAAPGLSTRRALADDEVCGVKIPKGASVNVIPWVLHRNSAVWSDPETFDPDRFSPEQAEGRPRFAYLPFGAGPRVCIGQVLAMNEAILALAALAQRYSADLAPGARVTPVANVTLGFRDGLTMILRRRAGSPAEAAAPADLAHA